MAKERLLKKRGNAYQLVRQLYDRARGLSWRRLNGALHSTLSAAIEAGLSFERDDFEAMFRDTNGSYWMGHGDGSGYGERYYSQAVAIGHTPACISFERWHDRPAALWSEKVKTPERLCVGSMFSYNGHYVTVTSMQSKHLVACSYHKDAYVPGEPVLGGLTYAAGGYRRVDYVSKVSDGSILLQLGPETTRDTRVVERVFKIKYEDLATQRREAEAARKEVLRSIREADTAEAVVSISQSLSDAPRSTYRHFDIDDFGKALAEKRKEFEAYQIRRAVYSGEAERLEQWRDGGARMGYFETVALRIRGAFVETSTGQSATIKESKSLLPWALEQMEEIRNGAHRHSVNDRKLDYHEVKRVQREGLLIGCTLVPWPEIERIAPLLSQAAEVPVGENLQG